VLNSSDNTFSTRNSLLDIIRSIHDEKALILAGGGKTI